MNMILSAMQNSDGDGVASLKHQLSNNEHEITMDASSCPEDDLGRDEGSMVSNLPLLFANGSPTCLEKITLDPSSIGEKDLAEEIGLLDLIHVYLMYIDLQAQLERFVSFMVHCSLGHDTTKIISKPQWWPQDIKFSSPLTRPKSINENWIANLKKLVFRCYTYHRSEYLLRFCSYLARYPLDELEYVNNWDSTTSLYHKNTGKLLVTFRNENMNYDKKSDSSRRTLLSHNASSSSHGNKTKQQNSPMMVQPPCDDIYLCDNCDAEFVGLAKMKEHEKICCDQDHGGSGSRSSTPDLFATEPELQQHQFLEYFKLSSNNKTESKLTGANSASDPDSNVVRRTSRRVRGSINFARCATIPFSSPAGLVLAKKSKAMTEETQQERLDRIERHVIAPVLTNSCRPKWLDADRDYDRWMVTYKQNRDKPADGYVHKYNFIKSSTNKPVLDIRSQLMYVACRPIYTVLTRLSQMQIDELKQDPTKYQCPQPANIGRVMLTRKTGPACKTRSQETACAQNASLKRKAMGDESDPIVVEDDGVNVSVLTASTKKALTAVVRSSPDKVESARSAKEKRSGPTNAIMLIDLCSSDDEEGHSTLTPCDENRDPMSSTELPIAKSFLRKLTPNNKLYAKPCIYPAASSTDRLSNNVLNEDKNENCTNKCRTGMLNGCVHLSSILRRTP